MRKPPAKKLSLEQHRELGEQLLKLRAKLCEPQIAEVETKNHRATRAIAQLLWAVDRVRVQFDYLAVRDFPDIASSSPYFGAAEPVASGME